MQARFIRNNIFSAAIIMACCLCMTGCKARRIKKETSTVQERTAFFTLSMSRDTIHNTSRAAIKSINVVDTKIRYLVDEAKTKEPNFLKVTIVYKNKQTVLAVIEHPLYKRFDLYSESGQIESKLISLPQAETVLRVPYFDDYKEVVIRETVNYKEAAPVILKHEK